MSRTTKRTRTLAPKTSASEITIRQVSRNGYLTHLVQGWQENGKWQRKFFSDEAEANTFASMKRISMENAGRQQHMILSALTQERHDEACRAFEALGIYSLTEAVKYFLANHRAPDYTIALNNAISRYIEDKESLLRERTINALKRSLKRFSDAVSNADVRTITSEQITLFLKSIRVGDTNKISRKTWNNYRDELHAFFKWCIEKDLATKRPYCFINPVESVIRHKNKIVREEQALHPKTSIPEKVRLLFTDLMGQGGELIPYFALCYFAGIRPEEVQRMNGREKELINLDTCVITIPAAISKTRQQRQVEIAPNLTEWLRAFSGPILPTNHRKMIAATRKAHELAHDEMRHSFISYHVALHRSVGDAALQAGNSETIVKRHYLNLHPREDGAKFFSIHPLKAKGVAVIKKTLASAQRLKVI
jgi:site-specific recombinase XerD